MLYQDVSGLLWILTSVPRPALYPAFCPTLCCSESRSIQAMESHWKVGVAFHKAGVNPFWLPDDLNRVEALHDLFPQNTQLHLRKTVTHTTMKTKAKG